VNERANERMDGAPGTGAAAQPAGDGAGYRAATEAAAWIDRSARLRMEFSGTHAAGTLNGLLTNDVTKLGPGTGHFAAALTPKGKLIADVRVLAFPDVFLVDADGSAGASFAGMIRKFVNPRLAKYRDVTNETCDIGVFGPAAARAVASVTGADRELLSTLAPFGSIGGVAAGSPVTIVRAVDLGVPGFDLIASSAMRSEIVAALGGAGLSPLDEGSAEVLRVEAGWPRWGADYDENVLAQEAAVDRLGGISFDKGCYTGQETVARVHFRGHVNRTLRGLRADTPVTPGAELVASDGAVVGTVRTAASSPRLGEIALAYVRREVDDGATVSVAGTSATVVPLPFSG
jgi:folate-binding protein YgfZ